MAVARTSSGVVVTSGGKISTGNCGTGAGGFKAGNTCAKGQARAKAGGEIGPNGEWYPGGAFIATTELSKMARNRLNKAATGRKEIEPFKYEVPAPGKLPIYANLMPGVGLNVNGTKDPAGWTINDQAVRTFNGSEEKVAQAHAMLDKYRAGERYADAVEFPAYIGFDDAARMALNDMPIPGDSLDGMAKIRGITRDELEKQLGVKRYTPPAE